MQLNNNIDILIQRIQSLFLLLVAFISGIIFFYTQSYIDIIEAFNEEQILYALVFLLAFISLFSFKNRKFQININYLNIIINVLLIGVSAYYILNLPGGDFPEKGIELIVPLISIILLLIANKFIQKDIELVKSVDRIR